MTIDRHRSPNPSNGKRNSLGIIWTAWQLCSFEAVFMLAIYSNQVEVLIPRSPIDFTLLFTCLSIPIGVWIVAREGVYVPGLPVVAAGLFFIIWVSLTYAWTPSRINAPRTISYLLVFGSWNLIVGAIILAANRRRALRFIILHLPLALFISLYGLYIYISYGTFRMSNAFEDAGRVYQSWGYLVSSGGAVYFALFVLSRSGTRTQILSFVLWCVCVSFLLVGGGRGPLVAHLFSCIIPLFLRLPPGVRGKILITHSQLTVVCVGVLVGAAIATLLLSGQATTTLGRFAKLIDQSGQLDNVRIGYDRFVYYPAAFRLWMQSPIIGNGIGSWSIYMFGAERPNSYPHNIVLQIMSETGLIGAILFAGFVWVSLRNVGVTRLRRDDLLQCVVLLLPTVLIAAMVSGDLSANRRVFLVLALMALRPRSWASPTAHVASSALRAPHATSRTKSCAQDPKVDTSNYPL